MAEGRVDRRRSPLEAKLPWSLPDNSLTLTELRFARQLGLRRRVPSAAYFAGLPLPLEPNRVATMGAVRVLWLGPDEWLIVAPDGAAPELPARLARAVGGPHASLLDLSSSRVVIAIAGPKARTLLEKGCGLDFHPRAFTAGHCAQTVFAGISIIIDQLNAAPSYRLFVRRSYARWLCEWLIDAAEEFRTAT